MFKKCICSLLCVIIMFQLTPPALAVSGKQDTTDIIHCNNTTQSNATEKQIQDHQQYAIDFSMFPVSTICSLQQAILSHCTYVDEYTVDSTSITEYSSKTLCNYLPHCKELLEISLINSTLYINYCTADNKNVILAYTQNALHELAVYDPATDTAYHQIKDDAVVFSNYRSGEYVTLSNELVEEIYTLISDNEIDSLCEIDGLAVEVCDDGSIFVSAEDMSLSNASSASAKSSTVGFTSNEEMLAHLKTSFPQYTNRTLTTDYLYCSALNTSVRIKVSETRNGYVKKTASYKSFAVGTTITAISLYLGIPNPAVIKVLSALSIALSLNDTLAEACKLYRSAVYTYYGERAGFAYDQTIHGTYVRVVTYADRGEFTGGYASNEVFTWVVSDPSTAYDRPTDAIASTTIDYYNGAIVRDGACLLYQPD